jgi:outer membrane protein assembly factor BamB
MLGRVTDAQAPAARAPRRSGAVVVASALFLSSCSAPLTPVFSTSGDAPSRTGLTPLGDGAVFGNDAGRVIRLDSHGRPTWAVETGGEIHLPLVVAPGERVVAAAVASDVLVALDAADGRELWRAGGQPEPAALAGVGDRVLALSTEGELRAFAAERGGMPWRRAWNVSLGVRATAPATGLLAAGADLLAVGPAAVLALSGVDGSLRWKAAVRESTGVANEGATLWTTEAAGRVLALDARTGGLRRTVPVGRRIVSPPSLALGRVWVGLEDATLVGIDTRGGEPVFRASLPGPMVGGVTEWHDRLLVPTASREGRLLAIDLARPGSPATARVDNPLRTRPLARAEVAWQLASDGRVLGFRMR